MTRYLRLWFAFGRFGLVRELAFRGNFLVKITVEVLWLAILLIFYDTVFTYTQLVAGWSRDEYMFFLGCYYTMEGLIETLFLSNCGEFADLIRSGDLDFSLLLPIDEQFLISCRNIDWSTVPNAVMGVGIMTLSLVQMDWAFEPLRIVLFVLLFACSLAMAYSFLLILTSSSVWLVRNQSLFEMWWLFSTLYRYPKEIFDNTWAAIFGRIFTYVLPIMLVVNVPAQVMIKAFEPTFIALTLVATAVSVVGSRWVFRAALRRYRSASS
jgi:ABC-2 type transport system permease protein